MNQALYPDEQKALQTKLLTAEAILIGYAVCSRIGLNTPICFDLHEKWR